MTPLALPPLLADVKPGRHLRRIGGHLAYDDHFVPPGVTLVIMSNPDAIEHETGVHKNIVCVWVPEIGFVYLPFADFTPDTFEILDTAADAAQLRSLYWVIYQPRIFGQTIPFAPGLIVRRTGRLFSMDSHPPFDVDITLVEQIGSNPPDFYNYTIPHPSGIGVSRGGFSAHFLTDANFMVVSR